MLFIWILVELVSIYSIIKKKHLLFDERITTTMCTAITMISSFSIALHIKLLLPEPHIAFYLFPILTGLIIGWKFDKIIKPAALSGIYHGTMGGIMGMMLGSVLLNPALCNIPIKSDAMMVTNMYSLAMFIALIHGLISHLIRYSFKGRGGNK
ncbi:hypothetical protein [Lederbergia citrea]|nr:hypothetical protein [Lederbergia citrea]